jgi:tetratricopeptide (TPR) repeat protein
MQAEPITDPDDPKPDDPNPDDGVRAARRMLRTGRAAAAERLFRARLATAPGDGVAMANLGVALDALNRHDEAEAAYRAALTIDPAHAEAHHNLGLALMRRGDPAAAAHLRRARALAAGRPQLAAEAALASLLAEARPRDGEAMLAGPAAQGLPASLIPAAEEALSLRARGFAAAAFERLRAVLAAAPAAGLLTAVAGEQALWLGRLEEARPWLTQGIRQLAVEFTPREPEPKQPLDKTSAAAALFAAIEALEAAGLAPFLNGGTALGCVRERDFIAHDSDVDLGLLPGADAAVAIEAIAAHPALDFLYHDVVDDRVLRIRFAAREGGVGGDVFLYQDDAKGFWCGVQRGPHALAWADSRFALAPAKFLDRNVMLPDPIERYLRENYGDWRTPDPAHVPGFSAPNLLAGESMLIRCTAMLSLAGALSRGDAAQCRRYASEAAARFPDEAVFAEIASGFA